MAPPLATWAPGYQATSGFMPGPDLVDGITTSGGYLVNGAVAATVGITGLLDYGTTVTVHRITWTFGYEDVGSFLFEWSTDAITWHTVTFVAPILPPPHGGTFGWENESGILTADQALRYLRMSARNQDTSAVASSVGLREIDAYDAAGNLLGSVGVPITAGWRTGFQADGLYNGAPELVDSDTTTYDGVMMPAGTPSEMSVVLDLGAVQSVDTLVWRLGYANVPTYLWEHSNDLTTWTPAVYAAGSTDADHGGVFAFVAKSRALLSPVSAKYWRYNARDTGAVHPTQIAVDSLAPQLGGNPVVAPAPAPGPDYCSQHAATGVTVQGTWWRASEQQGTDGFGNPIYGPEECAHVDEKITIFYKACAAPHLKPCGSNPLYSYCTDGTIEREVLTTDCNGHFSFALPGSCLAVGVAPGEWLDGPLDPFAPPCGIDPSTAASDWECPSTFHLADASKKLKRGCGFAYSTYGEFRFTDEAEHLTFETPCGTFPIGYPCGFPHFPQAHNGQSTPACPAGVSLYWWGPGANPWNGQTITLDVYDGNAESILVSIFAMIDGAPRTADGLTATLTDSCGNAVTVDVQSGETFAGFANPDGSGRTNNLLDCTMDWPHLASVVVGGVPSCPDGFTRSGVGGIEVYPVLSDLSVYCQCGPFPFGAPPGPPGFGPAQGTIIILGCLVATCKSTPPTSGADSLRTVLLDQRVGGYAAVANAPSHDITVWASKDLVLSLPAGVPYLPGLPSQRYDALIDRASTLWVARSKSAAGPIEVSWTPEIYTSAFAPTILASTPAGTTPVLLSTPNGQVYLFTGSAGYLLDGRTRTLTSDTVLTGLSVLGDYWTWAWLGGDLWLVRDNGATAVQLQRSRDGGRTVGAGAAPGGTGGDHPQHGRIAIDRNGTAAIIYWDAITGNLKAITSRDRLQTWTAAGTIDTGVPEQWAGARFWGQKLAVSYRNASGTVARKECRSLNGTPTWS